MKSDVLEPKVSRGWDLIPPGVAFLLLLPVLQSGYSSDDLLNACIGGHDSLWAYLRNDLWVWLFERGRLCPGTIIWMDMVHGLLPKVGALKAFVVGLVVADVWLLARLVGRMTGDRGLGNLVGLLFPLFFQVRNYHDPLLHFAGLIPFLSGILLLSFLAASKYGREGGMGWILISALLYLAALLTYEISFVLMPLYVLFMKGQNLWERFCRSWPYLLVWVLTFALAMTLHRQDPSSPMVYPGTSFGTNLGVMTRTFGKQVFSTLPLSYAWMDPSGLFHKTPLTGEWGIRVRDILCGLVFSAGLFSLSFQQRRRFPGSTLAWWGIGFLLLPAMPIALSHKYQLEFASPHYGWGLGYIPVLMQGVGAATLAGWGFSRVTIGRVRPKGWIIPLVVALLSVPLVAHQNRANRLVVAKVNADCHDPRNTLVLALEQGLLRDVPEGATLYFRDEWNRDPFPAGIHSIAKGWMAGTYPWFNSDFAKIYSQRRFTVVEGTQGPHPVPSGAFTVVVRSFPVDPERREDGRGGAILLKAADRGSRGTAWRVEKALDTRDRGPSNVGSLPVVGTLYEAK